MACAIAREFRPTFTITFIEEECAWVNIPVHEGPKTGLITYYGQASTHTLARPHAPEWPVAGVEFYTNLRKDITRFLTRAVVVLSLLTPLTAPSVVVAQDAQDELITIKSDRQTNQNILTLIFGSRRG